ncbi:hypothetical protein CCHL11_03238 [Colletotrichum chlorophyti]|uniref:DUF7708 domain-containing protein n=1 Tax=Colletotrichum chlorophyti TaxID=708187 RepID=A0A1Q8S3T6_9PEZI|nr:hypothetical protein CCHL11_03238 [Colletotrichum chlorophyti]
MNSVRNSRVLVRVYSFDAEERLPPSSDGHTLARILAETQDTRETARDPWRRFFESTATNDKESFKELTEADESNPITKVLAVETTRLREKWLAFRDSCPAADRLDLQASEPTMAGVIDTVQGIQNAWDAKRQNGRLSKAKRLFHKFCGTLNSHKLMIQMLPSANEYVSIFTGTLNVIIQASANHEKIAEGLSEALCTMSEYRHGLDDEEKAQKIARFL